MPEAANIDPQRFNFDALFSHPAGEELPTDTGTDRTDSALKARSQSYQQSDDANWLIEGTDVPAQKPQGAGAPKEAPSLAERLPGLAGAVAQDIAGGAVETPTQIVGGMRDAVQSMVDFSDEMGRMASFGGIAFTDAKGNFAPRYVGREEWNKLVASGEMQDPFGGVQFTDKDGNVDVKYLGPDEWRKVKLGGLEEALPDVRQPETISGAAVRGISQFLTGFRV